MKIFYGSVITLLLITPVVSIAQSNNYNWIQGGTYTNTVPAGSGNSGNDSVELSNPLGSIDSFPKLIKAILDGAFIIGVPIAVLFVVIAGFRFVLARGNPEQLKKAKVNMLYTIVGIAVFFGAWLITNIIVSTLRAINVSI